MRDPAEAVSSLHDGRRQEIPQKAPRQDPAIVVNITLPPREARDTR